MNTTEPLEDASPLPLRVPTLCQLFSVDGVLPEPKQRALAEGSFPIGREVPESTGINLANDRGISRIHATVIVGSAGGALQIVDHDSRNGTFVNGLRVKSQALAIGDIIRLGNSILLVGAEEAHHEDANVPGLLGVAPAIRALRSRISHIAQSDHTILILGESGVGKEVVAKALHARSGRSGPLIAVNCAAIPESLAESQMFGHRSGSFTGAHQASQGFFLAAHRGTLFLDEIGDLAPSLQAKVLRAVEDRSVLPVGATVPQQCDVRIIAATNRNLWEAVQRGQFRGDLYARVAELPIHVPPLRNRREDILLLFVHAFATRQPRLTVALAERLLLYQWPFNVREINKIAAYLSTQWDGDKPMDLPLLARGESIAPLFAELTPPPSHSLSSLLPPPLPESAPAHPKPADPMLEETATSRQPGVPPVSRETLVALLRKYRGHMSKVAKHIGRSRKQLDRYMLHHGLQRGDFLDPE